MSKVAVLGANGQVGAELCLLLARQPDIDLVPVCRNRLGSAYLRYRGIACRHGQPADPAQAPALFGDCDVIVNLALVGTLVNPQAARATNRALLENIAACAPAGAKHVYFSTMSVYGDRQHGQLIAFRNSYGSDKWRAEKLARATGARSKRDVFVFRLGHVCGELQGITRQVRQALRNGPIRLPDPERHSNTVHVVTIVDAIVQVARGRVPPGTYDLMNVPQWSWREVFEHEARSLGTQPHFEVAVSRGSRNAFGRMASAIVLAMARAPSIRRLASRLVLLLPIAGYRRIKAEYSTRAAGAEIRALRVTAAALEATLRTPVGSRFAPGLEATATLLARADNRIEPARDAGLWPSDLSLFEVRAGAQHETVMMMRLDERLGAVKPQPNK